MLHELISGAPPFGFGGSPHEHHQARLARRPRLAAPAPAELDVVLDAVLAPSASSSIATAAELARALEALLSDAAPKRPPVRRGRALALLGVAAVASVGALGALLARARGAARGELASARADLLKAAPALERAWDEALVGPLTSECGPLLGWAREVSLRASVAAARARRLGIGDAVATEASATAARADIERAQRARGASLALASSPGDALALLLADDADPATACVRARALVGLARLDEAERELEKATRASWRRGAVAWDLLGDVRVARGELDAAREAYTSAAALEGTEAHVTKRALAALATADESAALLEWRRHARSLPSDRRANASLRGLAHPLYRRGLAAAGEAAHRPDRATAADALLDAAWKLDDPPADLVARVVPFWLEEAETASEGLPLPPWTLDDKALVASLRRAIDLSARAAHLQRDAEVTALWKIARTLRAASPSAQGGGWSAARAIFDSWPEHPAALSFELRALRDRGDLLAALDKTYEVIASLRRAVAAVHDPEKDIGLNEIQKIASDAAKVGDLVAAARARGVHADLGPLVWCAFLGATKTETVAWVNLADAALGSGQLEVAQTCVVAAEAAPDFTGWGESGFNQPLRLLLAEKDPHEAVRRARAIASAVPPDLARRLLVATLERDQQWEASLALAPPPPTAPAVDRIENGLARVRALRRLGRDKEAAALDDRTAAALRSLREAAPGAAPR